MARSDLPCARSGQR